MPLDAESRHALFERIIAAGDRRRRRWLVGPGVVLAVSVLSLTMLSGGDKTRLAVIDEPTASATTTLAPAPTSDTSLDTTEPPTTGSTVGPSSTTEQLACRNSYDPRCGPFYWDYDPATWPNAPLELSVTSSPSTIAAGEPVYFSLRFFDPDVPGAANCGMASFPGSTPGPGDQVGYTSADESLLVECNLPGIACGEKPYGPWDPPPPRASDPQVVTVSRVYSEAGDYTVQVKGRSEGFFCPETFGAYNSTATITVPVHVAPTPQP